MNENPDTQARQVLDKLTLYYGPKKKFVAICAGTGCRASGSLKVKEALEAELKKQDMNDVDILATGCLGFCEKGPMLIIHPDKYFYQHVKVEDVSEIVSKTVGKGEVISRLLYRHPETKKTLYREEDLPFYKKQHRIVFGQNGMLDPSRIEAYFNINGYQALAKVLSEMTPEAVISEVKKAGLRGRGGGGFPTAVKWEGVRRAHGEPKYVIANGDEGDPGAYMDRSLMEGNPHSVIEGMIIGAYAVGAHEGYIYVRNEYPLAVTHLTIAIEAARENGLLGKISWARIFHLILRSTRARAHLSAASPLLSLLRLKAAPENRAPNMSTRWKKVCMISPPSLTTWKPGPTFRSLSIKAPIGMRPSERKAPRALRSFLWSEKSTTRV